MKLVGTNSSGNWLKAPITSVDWLPESGGSIDQDKLNHMIEQHRRFLKGLTGGRRLNIALFDAQGLQFDYLDLTEAEFRGARMSGSSFVGSVLTRANLFGADLRQCDMRRCDLTKADLRGAVLRGAWSVAARRARGERAAGAHARG